MTKVGLFVFQGQKFRYELYAPVQLYGKVHIRMVGWISRHALGHSNDPTLLQNLMMDLALKAGVDGFDWMDRYTELRYPAPVEATWKQ